MKKDFKQNNAITLIALVITIIVLLILAGVTIVTLTGDNGLITKASDAQFTTEIAQYKEELNLSILEDQSKTYANRTQKFNENEYNKIKKLIPSFNRKYENILVIEEDKLVYKGTDETLYRMAVNADLIPEDELLDDEILKELQPFITEWTVEDGDSITLPLTGYAHNKYNFTVDYGDGSAIKEVIGGSDEDMSHTYENAGTYRVTIKGQCPDFSFGGISGNTRNNTAVSRDKITKIVQWGNVFKNNGGLQICMNIDFSNCTNLKGPVPEPTKNTFLNILSLTNMFNGCAKLKSEDIPKKLFYNCPKVTNYSGAFKNCSSLDKIPENLFKNCNKATNFAGLFEGCSSLKEIPENIFSNCTEVTNFQAVFKSCSSIKIIPKDLFRNCEKVTTFHDAFFSCASLEILPIDLFDNCPNAGSFFYAFGRCSKILGNAPRLWEMFPNANGSLCFAGCNFSNQSEIPSGWR